MVAVVAFAAPALAATNPFMDVPQGHWSYDAVGLLASRGIVSGYPDGAFKGAQPATRYEMASVVARALVTVDAEKASKQDLELLKKLVMEFKDELDALGVKVDSLDKRVAVLEDNLGGWKLYGELYFDAQFFDYDSAPNRDTDFGFGRARFYLTKQIDENTSMLLRMNMPEGDITWDRLYVDTKLPWDINFRFGRFNVDWEGDVVLYDPYTINNDATYGDWNLDGFQLAKTWGNFNATLVIGRDPSGYDAQNDQNIVVEPTLGITHAGHTIPVENIMAYALNLNYMTENWMLGAMGYMLEGDNGAVGYDGAEVNTYGVYAGYNFTPAIQLKGVYYWQDIDIEGLPANIEDSPTAWKAILDVKQDLLKFTALWIEYSQMDNTFLGTNSYNYMGGNEMYNQPLNSNTANIWNIIANQQWNDQWSTYIRYWMADWDTTGVDDTENWTFGVRYQYTPAIQFKLEYDMIDYGDQGMRTGDDNVFRFRTTVNF